MVGRRGRTGTLLLLAMVWGSLLGFSSHASDDARGLPAPSRGWAAPVLVHADQSHRETSLAINPVDPDVMLACAPSGVPNVPNNQSYFHVTRDGGGSWEPLRVEGDPTDSRNYAFEGGDCDVTFDQAGTMYAADTWVGNLSVGHSKDGGTTWSGSSISTPGLVVDRPWLVGGPEGTVHLTYQDIQCCMPSAIWYTRSTDFGQTFAPTTLVAAAETDGAYTWQGNLVVSEDGKDLYLAYTRRANANTGSPDSGGPERLFVAASHDGGASWASTLVVSMPNPMSFLYPSIALDGRGGLHVVFSSRTDVDRPIWYAFSGEDGKTWTKPAPVVRGAAGFSPWVAADERGNAGIVWYGSPDPAGGGGSEAEWYFYWARVRGGGKTPRVVATGTTTKTPIHKGPSGIPEFENVRLDARGRMHIGASAYRTRPEGGASWAIYYQREL